MSEEVASCMLQDIVLLHMRDSGHISSNFAAYIRRSSVKQYAVTILNERLYITTGDRLFRHIVSAHKFYELPTILEIGSTPYYFLIDSFCGPFLMFQYQRTRHELAALIF